MVQHVQALVSHILHTNGVFVSGLRRIQSGFLPEKNIEVIHRYLIELQAEVRKVEEAIRTPHVPDRTHIPMK